MVPPIYCSKKKITGKWKACSFNELRDIAISHVNTVVNINLRDYEADSSAANLCFVRDVAADIPFPLPVTPTTAG
jgi:hypothetical protein